MSEHNGSYFLPQPSHWPLVASIGLFCTVVGVANWLHDHAYGPYLFMAGALILTYTMFGWFGAVVQENQAGLHNAQMDRTYRWGMTWFIFSEVMFFGAFFGALFFARVYSVPFLGGTSTTWLGGMTSDSPMTHYLLWPQFKAMWPLLKNPDPSKFVGPKQAMEAWGLPAINTLILLTSGVTLTWAHWGMKKLNRGQLKLGLLLTVILGASFLVLQVHEYMIAYNELQLTLHSGIYGTTFFMLTGFHGAHVTIGTIMLFVMLVRSMRGHFTPDNHFAFEAVAWYWHFVDVVWLLLFVLVYWL